MPMAVAAQWPAFSDDTVERKRIERPLLDQPIDGRDGV